MSAKRTDRRAKRHQYLDQAVQWISDGLSQTGVVDLLVQHFALSRTEAGKLYLEAYDEIGRWPDKPVGWHKRWLQDLITLAIADRNYRVALEARRDLAKIERLADGPRQSIELDTTREGLLAYFAGVIARLEAGEIGVAKAQAEAQLLQSMIKLHDLDDEEEGAALPARPELADEDLRAKVAQDIIDMAAWTSRR